MFVLKEFVKKGLIEAVGRIPNYKIILDAVGWHDKGVLLEEDLAEIQTAIDAQHTEPDMTAENE